MNKQLHIVTAQPNDLAFYWETLVQLYNAKKQGFSHLFRVLVYVNPEGEQKINQQLCREKWQTLPDLFPEVKFFFYEDTDKLSRTIKIFGYPSLQRPYILSKHFKEFPELKKDAIFYIDGDVLLHRGIDFIQPYVQDDVNYLSYTGRPETRYNYISADHFYDKMKNIEEKKLETFRKENFMENFLRDYHITEQEFADRKEEVGGAQYLLKNIDSKFWEDVLSSSIVIKFHLHSTNQRFMMGDTPQDKENNGFQSWCADMWAVLFNLWRKGLKTPTPRELDFAWATDTIDQWNEKFIFHNAGGGEGIFNKRKMEYVQNMITPFQDDLAGVSDKFCSFNYVKEIIEAKNYFNL